MTEPGVFKRVLDVLLAAYAHADGRGAADRVDTVELLRQVQQHFLPEVNVGGSDEYSQALSGLAPLLAAARNPQVTEASSIRSSW